MLITMLLSEIQNERGHDDFHVALKKIPIAVFKAAGFDNHLKHDKTKEMAAQLLQTILEMV